MLLIWVQSDVVKATLAADAMIGSMVRQDFYAGCIVSLFNCHLHLTMREYKLIFHLKGPN